MAKLRVHVRPGAKRDELLGFRDGVLRLKIAAPPIEGRANKALEAFLAGLLGVPKQAVTVITGLASRDKLVEVAGVTLEDLLAKINSEDEDR